MKHRPASPSANARFLRFALSGLALLLAVPFPARADDEQAEPSVSAATLDVDRGALDLNLVREDASERMIYDVTVAIPGRKVDLDARVTMEENQTEATLAVKVKEHSARKASSLTLSGEVPELPMGLSGGDPVAFAFTRADASASATYAVDFSNATKGEFSAPAELVFAEGETNAVLEVSANFSRLDVAQLRIVNAANAADRFTLQVPVRRSALATLEDNFHVCFVKKIPFGKKTVRETAPDGTVTEREEQVYKARWNYLTHGLRVTIIVAFCSVLLGAVLGFLVAVVRSTHDHHGRMKLLNAVCKVYITVIRGTPMTVQLLIAYFIVFASFNNKILVAILAFGFNSGAYVAEIIRAGIESIDRGQMEAARSLGMSYVQGMARIVLPQAFRNVLPALGNEFIVLLKDTSIASFIGLDDLARGGSIIRSQTYQAYIPFLAVAGIYLIMVMIFSKLLGKLERRLQSSNAH